MKSAIKLRVAEAIEVVLASEGPSIESLLQHVSATRD
jgi:hypothetical protein